jgi:hypothetical protein
MHSLLESFRGAGSDERAIGWLRDRAAAPLAEFRRLFAQEFSRLELRAKPYCVARQPSHTGLVA